MKKTEKSFEVKKQELELKKLELESNQLEYYQSKRFKRQEYFKSIAAIGGLITAILALITFFFTVYKWSYEEEKNRIYLKDNKVETFISNLLNNEKSSNEKYKSTILLGNYLTKENKKYHSQILSCLANALNQEINPKNREAINTVFKLIKPQNIDEEILNTTLSTLIGLSREKNKKYKLYDIYDSYMDMYWDIDSTSHQAIAIDISKSILILFRKGIIDNDLSDIYCFKCDFTNLKLLNINFENAILISADFSNSDLSGSNFNDADLDLTKFIHSKLKNSKFTSDYFKTKYNFNIDTKKNYVIRQLDYEESLHQPIVRGPDFSNADLANADFSGHLLFQLNVQGINNGGAILAFNPFFTNANLTNTNFKSAGIYGANYDVINGTNTKKPVYPFLPFNGYYETQGKSFTGDSYALYIYQFNEELKLINDNNPEENFNEFAASFVKLREAFEDSNWRKAKLPKPIDSLLNLFDQKLINIKRKTDSFYQTSVSIP